MAEKTISIADKPTLDEVKELLENSGYGLEALKALIGESNRSLYNGDVICGKLSVEKSALSPKVRIEGSGVLYITEESYMTIKIDGKIPEYINSGHPYANDFFGYDGEKVNYKKSANKAPVPIEFKESVEFYINNTMNASPATIMYYCRLIG